ncbi:MAG: ABC transporter substrate-binding protein [Burkholderiales bacterium]|nr:ABC transporter substrate-binding protein [Burkholderiales bacterium]
MRWMGGVLMAVAMLAAKAETGVTDTEIVLGQSAAMSGPAAELGKGMNRGAKAYFDWVNQHGGINGRKIRLVAMDDGYEPNRAEANTQALIENTRAFALFGYVGTPTSNASLPLVDKAHIPFIAPYTGADSLRNPFNRNVFNMRASYRDEAEQAAKLMAKMGQTTVNVFYQNDAYGKAGLKALQQAIVGKGITIGAMATVERNTVDVAQAVDELIVKHPANAVFMVSAYKSCAAFIDAARGKDFIGPYYNVSFVGTEALLQQLKKDGSGVIVTQVMPSPYSAVTPATMEYRKMMAADGSEQYDYPSLEGYFAARLLVDGLKRAGRDLTRDRLVAALEGLGEHDMGGFRVKFGPGSHNGSHFIELTVLDHEGHIRI